MLRIERGAAAAKAQFLAVRILEFTGYSVGLVSTIGCARKIETPEKCEKNASRRLNDIEQREALLREREADLERRKLQILTEMQQRQQQFEAINTERWERQQQFYEQAIAQLRQQIAIANAPRWDISGKTQSQNCNAILQHLWREHDIVVDCHEQSQYDPASQTETYILRARSPKDVKKIVSEDLQSEYEAVLHGEGAIKASQHGGLIVIKFAVGQDSRQAQVKKREALQSQMFKIEQTVGLSLGYFLAGNSGSGKTAIASYLAHVLVTKKPTRQEQRILLNQFGAEGIVLDIHNNAVWQEVGLKVIYEPLAILDYILAIRQEYKQRKGGKKGNRLVVFVDELEELLTEMEASFDTVSEAKKASKAIADTVRMLGSGGRKFALNIIVMNQSWNTTAIKLDSNHRNNFVGIALNAACDNYVQQKCGAKTFDKLRDWVFGERKDKYRAITFGAVSPRAILHPTHHDYQKVADGQPPQNLKTIQWLPLSISSKGLDIEPVPLTKLGNGKEQRPGEDQSTPTPVQSFPQTIESLEYPEELGCGKISPRLTVAISQSEQSSILSSVHQSTDVVCPYCQQTNLIKNGKKRGKQRWQCKDCEKFFTVDE